MGGCGAALSPGQSCRFPRLSSQALAPVLDGDLAAKELPARCTAGGPGVHRRGVSRVRPQGVAQRAKRARLIVVPQLASPAALAWDARLRACAVLRAPEERLSEKPYPDPNSGGKRSASPRRTARGRTSRAGRSCWSIATRTTCTAARPAARAPRYGGSSKVLYGASGTLVTCRMHSNL